MQTTFLIGLGLSIGAAVWVGTASVALGVAAWLFCGFLVVLTASRTTHAETPPAPRTPRARRTMH